MRFILLGSGCVRPDLEHWGPAQVVQVAGQTLLFDCGRGATMRLVEAGIPIQALRRVFFTHHHFDHNCDFAYLFLASWTLGRNHPMEVYGPRGTEHFCDTLFQTLYRDDIHTRRIQPTYPPHGKEYAARDVLEDTWELEGDGYRIQMIHVLHKPQILDNLAFRVEAEGKAIVIAGDNILCESLMDLATGCDLLVHECTFPTERIERHRWGGFHTSPRALGRWARERGVKKLVLKHYAIQEGVAVEPMVEEVRSEFGSEGLIAGHDLLALDI
ncbi:MAG TPA: MBL fold metallo-hydrolase [Planctomycetota bacterium]|nr:MBL fold metallo-hydrolase [Planctomycetota bacterium]